MSTFGPLFTLQADVLRLPLDKDCQVSRAEVERALPGTSRSPSTRQ
jgi:hypothetical protein